MGFCYEALTILFHLSVTGSVAILAVLTFRLLLRKAPRQFSYLLWGIVLFRLLCPVSFSSPISFWNLASSTGENIMPIAGQTVDLTESGLNEDKNINTNKDVATASVSGKGEGIFPAQIQGSGATVAAGEFPKASFYGVVFAVWLAGAVGLAGYGILSALRLGRRLRCSLHIRDNIYLADGIETPFVFGLLRPKVYLPSHLGDREADYIILHEQYHISRRDYLFRALAFAALCLHWFNPLVWLAFALSGKDMEMSCDEAVMKMVERDIRPEYAQSLLSLAAGRKRMVGMPLAFGESDTKSRIKNVMNYKKPGVILVVIAALACTLAAACFATNPIPSVSDEDAPSENASLSGTESSGVISGAKEDDFAFGRQITAEEEKVIKEEILKASMDPADPEEYDVSCCSFVNLKKVASEKDGIQTAIFYGWSYYAQYNYGEGGLEEVSGFHVPEALTFRIDKDGYHLQEYWTPGDGDDYYMDIQKKFPGEIVHDAMDSQKFVLAQVQDCYAQAVSQGDVDTDPIIERLLDKICSGMPGESSNPQDYIDAHDWEYQELGFYGSYTVRYCVSRFEAGMETGLEGQVMARILEELLGTKGKLAVNAGQASNGQEWYDSLKKDAPEVLKDYVAPEKEPAVTELGIPVCLPENASWIQNRVCKQSDEHRLEIQYYDLVLGGQCTLWAAKDEELDLPEAGEGDWKEETWAGTAASGETVNVSVKYRETQVLAEWEYQNYQFAILGEVPAGQADVDISPVPKAALNVIMGLE